MPSKLLHGLLLCGDYPHFPIQFPFLHVVVVNVWTVLNVEKYIMSVCHYETANFQITVAGAIVALIALQQAGGGYYDLEWEYMNASVENDLPTIFLLLFVDQQQQQHQHHQHKKL